jgi:hypothetical protein
LKPGFIVSGYGGINAWGSRGGKGSVEYGMNCSCNDVVASQTSRDYFTSILPHIIPLVFVFTVDNFDIVNK